MASIWESLGSMFGKPSYQNPADAAMPYLNQVPGQISNYYQPYSNTGRGAMNQYYGQMQNLGTPQGAMDVFNQMAGGYSESPWAKQQTDQMTQSMGQLGAASGMAGTPSMQLALANQIQGITSKDQQNYQNMVSGLYGQGLGGLQDLTHLGYQADSSHAEDLIKNLMAQAGLSYSGAANQNNYNSALAQGGMNNLSGLLGAGGSLYQMLFGGGIPSGFASGIS